MKKLKVWIATASLLLALTTIVLPTLALADPPQGGTQPAPQPPPPPPPSTGTGTIIIIIAGALLGWL